MSNILMLCSGYFGNATANGLCVHAMVDDMRCKGHNVGIISVGSDEITCLPFDGDNEISVPYKKNKPVGKPKNAIIKAWRVGQVFLHAWNPKYNKSIVQIMTLLAKKECCLNKIDAIVCAYFPLEAVIAGCNVKTKFPKAKLIVYELDSVADGIAVGSKWRKIISHAYKCAMGRIYKKSDRVIIMKSHETHWVREHPLHIHKMRVSDLPVLVASDLPTEKKEDDTVRFIYSGALDNSYRSPKKMLETFKALDMGSWVLDFYSKGCEEDLMEASKDNSRIRSHGYVNKKDLDCAIASADILLSVGNLVSNSVPSKVITYMTYGKPIIHFSLQKNDVCVEYLEKYPLALIVGCDEPISEVTKRVKLFVQSSNLRAVDFDNLRSALPMNLPMYSVELIIQLLGGENRGQ